MMRALSALTLIAGVAATVYSFAAQPGNDAIEKGEAALLEQSHIESMWPAEAYENAWKLWGLDEKPADYDAAFRHRYGLHPAPYENDGLPMGIRRATSSPPRASGEEIESAGLAIDCMLCHGGSILGQSYVGMPNTTLDLALLFDEMPRAAGRAPFPWPFPLSQTRGTTNAGGVAAFVLGFRNPDLTRRVVPAYLGWNEMPDLDPPAWWLWKRKKTIYSEGSTDARSARSTMQFVIAGNSSERIKALEPTWEAIRDYIWTLEPPKYPFPIDQDSAAAGQKLFTQHCARCHGTYGLDGRYPNKIVPIDEIGTDRARYDSISDTFRDYYNSSWLGEQYPTRHTEGYQAPPLDGIWATPPYLHNGSVPTVDGVLNSAARPPRFRRMPRTDAEAYDPVHLGWKVEVLAESPPSDLPPIEARKIFDTTQYGKGNGGHTFGDALSDDQRRAIIEYLKTL